MNNTTNTNTVIPEIRKILQLFNSHNWDMSQYLVKCYVYENSRLYYKYIPIILDRGQIEPLSSKQLNNIFSDKTKYLDILHTIVDSIPKYIIVDIDEVYDATGVSQLNYSETYINPIHRGKQ